MFSFLLAAVVQDQLECAVSAGIIAQRRQDEPGTPDRVEGILGEPALHAVQQGLTIVYPVVAFQIFAFSL